MDSQNQKRNPVEELAEEFLRRRRNGDCPTIAEYKNSNPELADQIEDLFPTLEMMEIVREDVDGHPSLVQDVPTEIGQTLGDFQIMREIGRGGMGVVYEAHQISLGRRVAVKVLAPSLQNNTKYLARFYREARAAANLQHANIVPVYGVANEGGCHFYVMQFIHGRGLDEVLDELTSEKTGGERDGRNEVSAEHIVDSLVSGQFQDRDLDPTGDPQPQSLVDTNSYRRDDTDVSDIRGSDYFLRIAKLGFQAADGLDHAHRNGICHRDIKPGNLLLDIFGNIWIADFGLVKLSGEESLTETGDIVGTLRYMAPECLSGKFDSRSDLYGLGLTLYELLAHRKVFWGENRAVISDQIVNHGPRPLGPEIPKDLRVIVHKAIAIEPNMRYESASEFKDDLQRFLNGETILAKPASWLERLSRWRKRNRALALSISSAVVLLIGGMIGLVAFSLKLNTLVNENHSAFLAAETESRDAKLRLFESNVLRAEGWAGSGLQGQRELALQAIREAIPIAKELGLEQEAFDRLRNATISSLASTDVQPIDEWSVSKATMFPAAFDANLERFVVCPELNSTMEVRRVSDQSLISKFEIKNQVGHEIWFSGNGKYLASRVYIGSKVGLVLVDAESGCELLRLKRTIRTLHSLCFSPDNRRFAVASKDNRLSVFELESCRETYSAQNMHVDVLRFDNDGSLVVCREKLVADGMENEFNNDIERLSKTYVAEFWNVEKGEIRKSIMLPGKALIACCGPKNLFAVICTVENRYRDEFSTDQDRPPRQMDVYQFPGTKPIMVLNDHLQRVRSLEINEDGRVIALGNLASTELRDVRTGAKLMTAKGRLLGFGAGNIGYRRFGKLGIQRLVLSDVHYGLARKQTWQHLKFHPSNEFLSAPTIMEFVSLALMANC